MSNKPKYRKQHRPWPIVHTSTIGYLLCRNVNGKETYEWVSIAHPNRRLTLNDYRKCYD